jgi:NAD(P)-dependent dehydrogenase (short-subunit alcohol dehydrogenase family)
MGRSRTLSGRVVLVTGVTAGIGRATAARLLAAGATVVGCARDEQRLAHVAGELPGLQVLPCGLRVDEQRAQLIDVVLDRHGRVDVLVNNAGVGYVGAVVDMAEEDVERITSTNVTAVLDLTRLVLPGMLDRGDGDLLMVSSVAAWVATPPLTAYAASKWAVDGFVEGLRREVVPHGLRVHSVNPAFTATEFHARALREHPDEGDPQVRRAPGVPADEVARVVRQQLESGCGRTVAVPRWAGVARAASWPLVRPAVDLVVRQLPDVLAATGREVAHRRS